MRARKIQQPLLMMGAGGHAKVLHALALALGHTIVGVCDPLLARQGQTLWRGIPVLGGDEALKRFDPAAVGLINGIGQLVGGRVRQDIYTQLRDLGFAFPALVHPAAWICNTVRLAPGVQVMAGAIIQPDCCIGENSIINTRASVDHDCSIGTHAHIAPGAVLCGSISIGDGVFIGSGATVIQGLMVGDDAVVGAGATLTRNLERGQIILGPAARLKMKFTS
jgi:sugar O-acyltransferase (sialic acid O-acetyltransferase NeuD family)